MQVPPSIRRYAWDADVHALDTEEHAAYIIERLLEVGDVESVRWMLQTYPHEQIAKIAQNARSISPKSRNFWLGYFALH